MKQNRKQIIVFYFQALGSRRFQDRAQLVSSGQFAPPHPGRVAIELFPDGILRLLRQGVAAQVEIESKVEVKQD
jgi:hypothetical protein